MAIPLVAEQQLGEVVAEERPLEVGVDAVLVEEGDSMERPLEVLNREKHLLEMAFGDHLFLGLGLEQGAVL